MSETPARPAPAAPVSRTGAVAVVALVSAAVLWACWPTLGTFVNIWSTNAQYSHGFVVGPMALAILWKRRALFAPDRRDRAWVGAALLLVGCGLKLVGGLYAFAWPDRIAVPVLVAGAVGTIGGWPALRWAWPALAFLVFLVPMPGRAEVLLSGPLQKFATLVSANVLQTFGYFAQPDGTLLILSEAELGIVEACSGLRMLLSFVAISAFMVFMSDRPRWQKVGILLAAVPVALVCNVVRIVATAMVMETGNRELAERLFHDLAGWLMMPMGFGLLWAWVLFLNRAYVAAPAPGGTGNPRPAAASKAN